jgi:hypothetical protein
MKKTILYTLALTALLSASAYAKGLKLNIDISPVPPNLSVSIKFLEPSGNMALDAEETGELAITVSNSSKGDAFDVKAKITPAKLVKGLYFPDTVSFGKVPSGGTVTKKVPMKASADIPSVKAVLKVAVKEARGFNPKPWKVTFNTKALAPPTIEISDVKIFDQNGNSKVEPMENVEIAAKVRNTGIGPGKDVKVALALGENVFISGAGKTSIELGDLAPGASKDFSFMFYTSRNLKAGQKIPISIKVAETRPRFAIARALNLRMSAPSAVASSSTKSLKTPTVAAGLAVPAVGLGAGSDPKEVLDGWYEKQYATVVGIDRYKNSEIEPLKNAVNDAKAVARMFKNKGFVVTELYNNNATRKAILSTFSAAINKTGRKDSFIFYFAGHGQGIILRNIEQVGYIIPYDADIDLGNMDVILYDEEAIPLNTIKKYSKNMMAKHIALLFDSCFSGLAMKRSVPRLGNVDIEYYKDLLGRKSINILTAGDDQPVSDGSGHSPFTQSLLNALDKGGVDINDRDGFATFSQLAVYVKEKVERATARRQRPQFDNLSMEDGDFIFSVKQGR